MPTKLNEQSVAKIGAQLLRLKSIFFDIFNEVYYGDGIFAFDIKDAMPFMMKSEMPDAYTCWNTCQRSSNGVLSSARNTRVLLDLVSICRAFPDDEKGKLKFGIYYHGRIYDLEAIASSHKIVSLKPSILKRLVSAPKS